MGFFVEFDVGERQAGITRLGAAFSGAAQYDSEPGDDFLEAERLRHIVVAAQGEPGDLVLQRVSCRQEQRGRVDTIGAQPAQHPETVHPGHHHVEDHRVGPGFARPVQCLRTVRGGVDLKTLELEADRKQFDDIGFIVDYQDTCFRSGFGWGRCHDLNILAPS